VIGPGQNDLVGVEPERQRIAGTHHIGGLERSILDRDGLLLLGGDQPVLTVCLAPQQPGKARIIAGRLISPPS
jgi:hypothetical protein